jgi:hypothetical protein
MKLVILNMQPLRLEEVGQKQEREAIIQVVSFQANSKIVTMMVNDWDAKESLAALLAIGLRPQVVQSGCQFILQTEQIHIKGIEIRKE